MVESTEAVTVNLLKLALDAAAMRQQAHAHNIANANTAGFRPVRVNFETQMAAIRDGLRDGQTAQDSALDGVRPFFERDPRAGSAVAVDMEGATMSQNAMQYQALLKALNKHLAILGTVINEGKR